MKKKLLFIFSIVAILFGNSCSNDFDLIDKWKNIPVVYGLINISDSVHYVRVEKAFVDPKIGADKLARIPDSLYYENIRVVLSKENGDEYEMTKIDGQTVDLPKKEGFFANQPNFLYKINASEIPLEVNESITLKIFDTAGDSILTQASTKIIGFYDFAINYPGDPITFVENSKTSISWRARNGESSSKFSNIKFVIHLSEQKEAGSNEYVNRDLTWFIEENLVRKVANNGNPSPSTFLRIEGTSFFNFLKDHLDNSLRIKRRLVSVDLIIDHGGEELFKYINIGLANTGITSAQTIPTYTNLSQGKGVFSSRMRTQKLELSISGNTRMELIDSDITKKLNFE